MFWCYLLIVVVWFQYIRHYNRLNYNGKILWDRAWKTIRIGWRNFGEDEQEFF